MRAPAGASRPPTYPVVLQGSEGPAGAMQRRPNMSVLAQRCTKGLPMTDHELLEVSARHLFGTRILASPKIIK